MRPVGELLPRAVRKTADREQLLAAVVLDAVGSALAASLPAPLARRVRPTTFRGGCVAVVAEGSVVAAEVRLRKDRILEEATRTLARRGFAAVGLRELRVRVG